MENDFISRKDFEDYKQLVKENHIGLKNVDDYQKEQIEKLSKRVDELSEIITQLLIK